MPSAPAKAGLAWLKGVFVEDVPDESPAAAQPVPTSAPAPAVPIAGSVVPPAPADAEKIRKLDASASKIFIDALEKDDAPLFEELSGTLESLKEAIPDEAARYKAALKLLSKRASVQQILTDYDKSVGTLEETYRNFERDNRQQMDARVGSKRQAVEALGQELQQLNQQLEALRTKIADVASRQSAEQAGISTEETKVALVGQRFELGYNAFRNEILSQRAKIAQYGQGS